MSWSNITSDTVTWSGRTYTELGWQQLSSVTESDGVDFVLRVNDSWPLRVIDPRPSVVINDVENP